MDKIPLAHVLDDDADVRDSLRMLLESVGMTVYTYTDAAHFLQEFKPHPQRPSFLLLDVRMPGISGMTLLERLRDLHPWLPVVMLTGHGDIPMAVRAIKLGAVDFISKPFHHQQLLDLVQTILDCYQPPGRCDATHQEIRARWQTLSKREQEIFTCIVSGNANKVTALDLGISIRTVETHRAHIMEKMQVRTLVDLVWLSAQLHHSRPS